MTVQTTTSRADYTGNGSTTAFTVPFYFLDNTHVVVYRTQISTGVISTLTLGSDYNMTGAGVSTGGTLTMTVAPTTDQKLSILRNVPLTQLIHYVPNDPFPAATHEQALDQLTMEVQQLAEAQGRALALSANTPAGSVSTSLPTPAANKLIGWDTTAQNLQNVDPSSLLTIAGSSGFSTQLFSGTGAQTAFTLSTNPGIIANLEVYISGVRQRPTTDYTLSGTTLTFLAAPASGTNNIFVRWGTTLGIGVVNDGAVSTSKIVDGNVTAAKLAAGAAVGNLGFTPQVADAATAKTNVTQAFTKAQSGAVSALTYAATITPDFSAANNFSVTLTGNTTLANPTNLTAGQSGVITITQDATGSRTMAFGSYWKFAGGTAPTLSTSANAVDDFAYYVESSTRIVAKLIGAVA